MFLPLLWTFLRGILSLKSIDLHFVEQLVFLENVATTPHLHYYQACCRPMRVRQHPVCLEWYLLGKESPTGRSRTLTGSLPWNAESQVCKRLASLLLVSRGRASHKDPSSKQAGKWQRILRHLCLVSNFIVFSFILILYLTYIYDWLKTCSLNANKLIPLSSISEEQK